MTADLPRKRADSAPPLGVAGALAIGLASVVVGLLLVALASVDGKWVVFVGGGVFLAGAAILTDVRRALLTYFVLGLSIDAHYYLTPPPLTMFTGDTSPGALSIPLAVVPGIALLVLRVLAREDGAFRFYPSFSKPALMVLATAAVAAALSAMWFTGLCVVWQLAALYLLFLVTANEVRSDRDADFVVKLLMVVLVPQCAIFFLQLATGLKFNAVGTVYAAGSEDLWHQATGTAAVTTAGFATFMQPLVALAYARARTAAGKRARKVYAALAILGAVVIVLTLNRSSLAALPLGIVAVEVFLRTRGLVKRSRVVESRMMVLGAVLAVVMLIGFGLVQSKRGTSFWDDLDQRMALMQPGFSMIKSHPLFGVGPGVYGYELRNHAGGHRGWLYIIHNDYILIWAERGTIGLLAWLVWARAVFTLMLAPTPSASRAAVGIGAAGGFAAHLWEVFWTACMSFPAYGVIFVLAGVCAGAAGVRAERQPAGVPERRALAIGTAA